MERREQRRAHKEDVNCGHLSLVMDAEPLDPFLIKGSCAVYGGGGGERIQDLRSGFWDPGSRIRDPGQEMDKNQDPRSRINIPDQQHLSTSATFPRTCPVSLTVTFPRTC
jgi:hypothetical protein